MKLTKNKVIITDCDEVLLTWWPAFAEWMNDKIKSRERKGYEIESLFLMSREEMDVWIGKFSHTEHFARLAPYKDAVAGIKYLSSLGYRFHVISSCGDSDKTRSFRLFNLHRLFGDVFVAFDLIPLGAKKLPYLRGIAGNYAEDIFYVDDALHHIKDSVDVPNIIPILMDTLSTSPEEWTGRRINNWSDFIEDCIEEDRAVG